jgi:hypothetical protein
MMGICWRRYSDACVLILGMEEGMRKLLEIVFRTTLLKLHYKAIIANTFGKTNIIEMNFLPNSKSHHKHIYYIENNK